MLLNFAEACTALCWCHWEIQSRQRTFLSLWMWCLFDHFWCLWTFCLDFVVFNSVTCPKCSLQWKWLWLWFCPVFIFACVPWDCVFSLKRAAKVRNPLGRIAYHLFNSQGSESPVFLCFFYGKDAAGTLELRLPGTARWGWLLCRHGHARNSQATRPWLEASTSGRTGRTGRSSVWRVPLTSRINGIHGLAALALQAEPAQVGRHVPIQECGISFAYRSCGG